jgi:hypothetical protein
MAGIKDYLSKNLDTTTDEKPLNEVDYSLLSILSYVDFEGIVSEGPQKITFKEAYDEYIKQGRTTKGDVPELFAQIANSARYKDMKLSHFKVVENKETLEQFGAYCVDSSMNHKMVFFRPTNGSLYAWKENFTVAYKPESCTQREAAKYFSDVAKHHPFQRFSLIGHSKGGNNAMYAGAKANLFNQAKIKQIINFDGPGFNTELNPGIENPLLLAKTTTYIPQGSVIGRLLDHKERMVVVKGIDPNGPMQHDMNEWLVGEDGFLRAEKTNYKSDIIAKKFDDILKKYNLEEREKLINGVFSVLENTGYDKLDDVMKNPKSLIHGYFKTDKKSRRFVRKFALSVLNDKKFMKAMFGKKGSKKIEQTVNTIYSKERANRLHKTQTEEDANSLQPIA